MKAPPGGRLPFTRHGLLAPISEDWGSTPIALTPDEFVHHLGLSRERVDLLRSLFDYRAALRAAQLSGFQWVHGDFVQDTEGMREEPPFAIEVMNFALFDREDDLSVEQRTLLFDDLFVARTFSGVLVESYQTRSEYFISERVLTFHLGRVSHITNDPNDPCLSLWKGILKVRFGDSENEDESAMKLLALGGDQ